MDVGMEGKTEPMEEPGETLVEEESVEGEMVGKAVVAVEVEEEEGVETTS